MANFKHYQRISEETSSQTKYSANDLRNAFLDGVLQGRSLRNSDWTAPCTDDEFQLRHFAEKLLIEQELLAEDRERRLARLMIKRYGYDHEKFRAMLFGNESAKQYVHKQNRRVIDHEAYAALSDTEQKRYSEVRYLEMNGRVYHVNDRDLAFIDELVKDDIATGGERISSEYAARAKDMGPDWRYQQSVKSHILEKLEECIVSVHERIKQLKRLADPVISKALREKQPDDRTFALLVIKGCCLFPEPDLFKAYYPQDEVMSYRDESGRPLMSLDKVDGFPHGDRSAYIYEVLLPMAAKAVLSLPEVRTVFSEAEIYDLEALELRYQNSFRTYFDCTGVCYEANFTLARATELIGARDGVFLIGIGKYEFRKFIFTEKIVDWYFLTDDVSELATIHKFADYEIVSKLIVQDILIGDSDAIQKYKQASAKGGYLSAYHDAIEVALRNLD